MKADTKTALLDTAEDVVRRRGFDGFSYADLSNTVGIRKASVHYHFPTKADLSSALIDRYHAELSARCDDIAAAHDTAAGRLLALVDVYRKAADRGRRVCLCVSLISSRESLSDDVRGKIVAFRAMMHRWIRSVFEMDDGTIADVRDPDSEAHATLALLEGAQLAARAEVNAEAFEQATRRITERCRAVDPEQMR